jgi:hypothetical protein
MRPRNEREFTGSRRLVGRPHGAGHDVVIGCEVADRVGAGGVAGELEGLAAAAAEVDLAAVTAPAGLRQPVRPAEPPEHR